nr:2-amino-4-hydroxy-6-hydroxymethyldihydropteridine diphosphokinase [Rhodospira trueperi]
MILIALGSNLPGPAGGPRETLERALAAFPEVGLRLLARSPWYRSAPVPPSNQPWFVNGVARATCDTADPADLLCRLHALETDFGRKRDGTPNAARTLDLDLLDMNGLVRDDAPILPHPRMTDRAFVLLPLADVVPDWRHPVSGRSVAALIAGLGQHGEMERIEETPAAGSSLT